MLESSVLSLIIYGVLCVLVYRLSPPKCRKVVLVLASLALYSIWAKKALIILILDVTIGYFTLVLFDRVGNERNKARMVATVGIGLIIIVLGLFKYTSVSTILVPLGISFFSFRIISVLVDVFLGKNKVPAFLDYCNYVIFFPHIIAGPISRIEEFNDDIDSLNSNDVIDAMFLLLKGLYYKSVIADRLAPYVNEVFSSFSSHNGQTLLLAAVFYSIELYADFAGYSYIAIGLSRLLGYRIKDNFCRPYFARSIKEFWNRWHISLSNWLRDYVYIPLGGNREGTKKKYINIIVVFLVSGIWHGNTAPYVIWGLWHGIWNILSPTRWRNRFFEFVSTIWTYCLVMFGWLCFKLDTFCELFAYIQGMFCHWDLSYDGIVSTIMPLSYDYSSVAKMLTIIVVLFLTFVLELRSERGYKEMKYIRFIIMITALIFLGVFTQNSFIYANY